MDNATILDQPHAHSIKVAPETYARLERLRRKRETFSQTVERLLTLHEAVASATSSGAVQPPGYIEPAP